VADFDFALFNTSLFASERPQEVRRKVVRMIAMIFIFFGVYLKTKRAPTKAPQAFEALMIS
jgi:hypothetical protein